MLTSGEKPISTLRIRELSVNREPVRVVDSVSLDVPKGKLIALVGANGAGKSTLLMCISGLLKPKSGRITFENTDLTKLSPHQVFSKGIVQVPEGRGVFKRMNVRDNLLVPVGNLPPKVFKERLERVYELFPILRQRSTQLASLFSGGEQQMLAVARGLMGNPDILLLDEPTLGLAPLVVSEIVKTLKNLCNDGLGILLVEQNAKVALTESDYGYVMDRGRIVLKDECRLLIQNPEIRSTYLGH